VAGEIRSNDRGYRQRHGVSPDHLGIRQAVSRNLENFGPLVEGEAQAKGNRLR
jgi:hypothetical protein